ncbi:hypothetical protein LTR22_027162 [Elasticomyces elasticus]|nr:hypothetical protein LTR22_027162 [Elasticomyces elasticus]
MAGEEKQREPRRCGGPRTGESGDLEPRVKDQRFLLTCGMLPMSVEEDAAIASDWRRMRPSQGSGVHLHHEIHVNDLDAPVQDEAVANDSDAHLERLTYERCLRCGMVPIRRRCGFSDVLQHLHRAPSLHRSEQHAEDSSNERRPSGEMSEISTSMAGVEAELLLKRRASPCRHHSWKLSFSTTPVRISVRHDAWPGRDGHPSPNELNTATFRTLHSKGK